MKYQNKFFFNLSYFALFVLFIISIFVIDEHWNRTILYLIILYSFILFFFLKSISYKLEYFPLLDLRVISAVMISIYILIPLVGYVVSDFQMNIYSDNRLRSTYKLKTDQFANFHVNYYLPFFISFMLTLYLLSKKILISEKKIVFRYPNALLIATLICLFIFETFFVVVSFIDNLPTILKQFNNIFGSFRLVCYASLSFYLLSNWRNKLIQIIIIIFLLYLFYLLFNGLISRSVFFRIFLVVLFLFSIQVYRFNIIQLFSFGLVLFLLAFLVGALNTSADYLTSIKTMGAASNEWWSTFGTAYDIHMMNKNVFFNYTTSTIETVPSYIYFNDLLYLLPQQLIVKADPSIWLLDFIAGLEGKPKGAVGFTWGALASIALWDNYLFTIIYGVLTAAIISLIHKFYINRSDNLYILILYVIACVYAYGIIRVGTGFFIYQLVYKTIPMIIILAILTSIFMIISPSLNKKNK